MAGQAQGAPSISLASTSAVLAPVGADTWRTTVLLDNVGTSCPLNKGSYLLETSRPDHVFRAAGVAAVVTGNGSKSQPNTCVAVTVTFSGLTEAPQSAALEYSAGGASPSSVQLTVSRGITLFEYLAVPVITGLAMVAFLMLLILYVVRIYGWDGSRIRPFRYRADNGSQESKKKFGPNGDFWNRTVSATGAWTVSDSWATNIATVVAVLTAVLTTTAAANSLFPGVALDRFSLVNVAAGAITAAVPLAFGILYARWIDRYRGITADSLIAPTMTRPDRCKVKLQEPTTVTYHPKRAGLWQWLVQDRPIRLSPEDRLALPYDDTRCLATAFGQLLPPEGTCVTLLAGTAVTQAGGPADERDDAEHLRTTLRAALEVTLEEGTPVERGFSPWVRIPAGGKVTISNGAKVPHGLVADRPIILPDGAIAGLGAIAKRKPKDWASAATQNWPGRTVTLLGGKETRATLCSRVGGALAGTEVTLPSGVSVTVCDAAPAAVDAAPAEPTVVAVDAPAGAGLVAPGGAIIGPGEEPVGWSTRLKDGGKIEVPPQSTINVYAYPGGVLALPAGSDVVVAGPSYFEITSGTSVLVVAGDNLAAPAKTEASPEKPGHAHQGSTDGSGQHNGPGKDDQPYVNLEFPVCGIAPTGVKITATGTAEIKFPAHMALTTPRRDDFTFRDERHVTVPQAASGTLMANMWLVIIAALITMFGVGAEVGVAGTLAFLSDAANAWQWVIVGFIAAVAVFTVYYGATAIRALADPQPGSSLSGTSGTSFTL